LYDLDHVINMDETGVPRDSPKNTTLEMKGTKHVVVNSSGKEKENYSVVLSISYTGKKLYTMIILEGKGVKQLKCVVPHNVVIAYSESSSWMKTKIMVSWIEDVLAVHAKKLPSGKKGLLIMDNHEAHIDEDVKKKIRALNYDIEFFLQIALENCNLLT